jgi:hypothetical protein
MWMILQLVVQQEERNLLCLLLEEQQVCCPFSSFYLFILSPSLYSFTNEPQATSVQRQEEIQWCTWNTRSLPSLKGNLFVMPYSRRDWANNNSYIYYHSHSLHMP